MSLRRSKKGVETKTLGIVMAAVILIALLLLSFYWIRGVGRTAKEVQQCEYECASEQKDCKDGRIRGLRPCEVDEKKGRCCEESPV